MDSIEIIYNGGKFIINTFEIKRKNIIEENVKNIFQKNLIKYELRYCKKGKYRYIVYIEMKENANKVYSEILNNEIININTCFIL